MTRANGHAASSQPSSVSGVESGRSTGFEANSQQLGRFSPDDIKRYTAELEIPFDSGVIVWRVTSTNHDKSRGQVIPYADQRAYTDRLNALFSPAGWTRRYYIHTSANFERSKDQKIVAKVLVTCELAIFGLGSHSATGEEWADNDNAGTSAEAQAFKRACSCFGLGRYLYHFSGIWVDLDERKRPANIPMLPKWATPPGWIEGFRPNNEFHQDGKPGDMPAQHGSLIAEIEAMAKPLGRGLYRGILRDLAKVWSPRQIRDDYIQRRVLEHMRSAERGLGRLKSAIEKTGREPLISIMRSLGVRDLECVKSLETLKRIVLQLESMTGNRP
jgi:hypothetical protein